MNSLPSAVLSAVLQTTGAGVGLSGTSRATYDSVNTSLALILKAAEGAVLTMFFQVEASTVLPVPITGLGSVTIETCSLLEVFDPTTQTCSCVSDATRTTDANANCKCVQGSDVATCLSFPRKLPGASVSGVTSAATSLGV